MVLKLLQTKPQVRSMSFSYDLLFTLIKNRDETETLNDGYENNENDYIIYNDCIIPNYHFGRGNDNVLLK